MKAKILLVATIIILIFLENLNAAPIQWSISDGGNGHYYIVVSAPEGINTLNTVHPDVQIVTASVDRELDENAYIRPGLGDAGDRIFGTTEI